jgi:hypothetical protein
MSLSHNVRSNRSSKKPSVLVKDCLVTGPTSRGQKFTHGCVSLTGELTGAAQEKYRAFVAEGRGEASPWEQVTGQIYLGTEAFVEQHQPNCVIRDIPRRQTQAQ